jgi:pimeloyl-ACP methyl ester carboxylesterase
MTWPLVAPVLYAPATRESAPERVAEDLVVRVEDGTGIATTVAQMAAIARHDVRHRLAELEGLPVLVLHGEDDTLVPPEQGRTLARCIPGARLVMIPTCGHLMTTDAEAASAGAVLEHLASHASRVAA